MVTSCCHNACGRYSGQEDVDMWRMNMGHKNYCVASGVLFSLVALAHLLRIVYGVPVQVDEIAIPMFASWIGLIVPGSLALWAFRTSRESSTA